MVLVTSPPPPWRFEQMSCPTHSQSSVQNIFFISPKRATCPAQTHFQSDVQNILYFSYTCYMSGPNPLQSNVQNIFISPIRATCPAQPTSIKCSKYLVFLLYVLHVLLNPLSIKCSKYLVFLLYVLHVLPNPLASNTQRYCYNVHNSRSVQNMTHNSANWLVNHRETV
jgi:hypothetical protein